MREFTYCTVHPFKACLSCFWLAGFCHYLKTWSHLPKADFQTSLLVDVECPVLAVAASHSSLTNARHRVVSPNWNAVNSDLTELPGWKDTELSVPVQFPRHWRVGRCVFPSVGELWFWGGWWVLSVLYDVTSKDISEWSPQRYRKHAKL